MKQGELDPRDLPARHQQVRHKAPVAYIAVWELLHFNTRCVPGPSWDQGVLRKRARSKNSSLQGIKEYGLWSQLQTGIATMEIMDSFSK